MCRELVFIMCFNLLTSIGLSAQSDTARRTITPPKSEITPSIKGSVSFAELFQVMQPGTLPIPIKYSSLAWTPKEKLYDSDKLYLNLNFAPPQNFGDLLRENPLKTLLLVAGTVAGMMNHQVTGIDKEIEINTMRDIYSRTPIPESARRADNSFNTGK